MKKSILILAAATLLTAALTEAKAGVSFGIRVGAPVYVPPAPVYCVPPAVVVTRPAVYIPAPPRVVVYQTPTCVYAPRVLIPRPPVLDFRFGIGHHHRPLYRICR